MTIDSRRTVGEAMARDIVTVPQSAKILVAAQLMDAHRLHGLPVIDADHHVVGVLSQTDLLRVRSSPDWRRLQQLEVRNIMTTPAITISVRSSLDDAARLMRGSRVHRLVVIDRDGTMPVGVLSVSDLVHLMAGVEEST